MANGWQDRGSTLVEYLVAMALAALVLSGMMSIYWNGSNVFQRLSSASDAQYAVRSAMHKMGDDIRAASEVSIQEGGTCLILHTTTGELVKYYMANNQLYRDGKAKVPIAENIKSLYFAGSSGMVTITAAATVNGATCQLISSISLRLQL